MQRRLAANRRTISGSDTTLTQRQRPRHIDRLGATVRKGLGVLPSSLDRTPELTGRDRLTIEHLQVRSLEKGDYARAVVRLLAHLILAHAIGCEGPV